MMPVPPVAGQAPHPQGMMPQPAQSPPAGISPATQPTRNAGYEIAAQKMTGLALLILERAMPLAGSNTPLGNEIHKCIGGLSKHVPAGSVTPADVASQIQQLMLKQQEFGAQKAALAARAQQQQQMPAPQATPMAQAA
ncbi:MAG: hypothetical protein KGL39_07640 [Patescibacteria group bacterium]|nr:hypothetical protein [Patescibacteria group bacterium]